MPSFSATSAFFLVRNLKSESCQRCLAVQRRIGSDNHDEPQCAHGIDLVLFAGTILSVSSHLCTASFFSFSLLVRPCSLLELSRQEDRAWGLVDSTLHRRVAASGKERLGVREGRCYREGERVCLAKPCIEYGLRLCRISTSVHVEAVTRKVRQNGQGNDASVNDGKCRDPPCALQPHIPSR